MHIGKKIRIMRAEKGLTLEDLSRSSFLDSKCIRNIETGKTKKPRVNTLFAIFMGLGLGKDDAIKIMQEYSFL